ncbi:HEAT repeat domain-containing protein [Nocardia pseudovaccinii]|uniref:HEAT repeat domain-containing protein n=1 Tax=Nocardia pseudovaccinii TaxID=189540 RepID=UPI0007A40C95|nr:HEAT repeat domain-containing protein [Nocardia pseudovaccinii]
MAIDDWVAQLGTGRDEARRAAVDSLVATGRSAIPALLGELCTTDSESMATACTQVLDRLGPLIYEPVLGTLSGIRTEAGSTEAMSPTEYRLCRLLGIARLHDAAVYAKDSFSADFAVRERVADDIGSRGIADHGFVLAVLLGDSDRRVRDAAAKSFAAFGTQLVPVLQQIRRSSLPTRRAALEALATIGWNTIDSTDLVLLARFVNAEIARALPSIPSWTCCLWWALPTEDQAAVLDAFGLSDPVPATAAMGTAVARENRDLLYTWAQCDRVYVSPALDGWTLVFGDPISHYPRDENRIRQAREEDFFTSFYADQSEEDGARWLEEQARPSREERAVELSARFGAAHWYKEVDSYEWGGWCIAENGEIKRQAHQDDGVSDLDLYLDHDPHPSEQGLRAESVSEWLGGHGFAPEMWEEISSEIYQRIFRDPRIDLNAEWQAEWSKFQQRTGIPDEMTASRIAERASIGPRGLGPRTRITGHGVVALTERGRQGGRHRGVLPLRRSTEK